MDALVPHSPKTYCQWRSERLCMFLEWLFLTGIQYDVCLQGKSIMHTQTISMHSNNSRFFLTLLFFRNVNELEELKAGKKVTLKYRNEKTTIMFWLKKSTSTYVDYGICIPTSHKVYYKDFSDNHLQNCVCVHATTVLQSVPEPNPVFKNAPITSNSIII